MIDFLAPLIIGIIMIVIGISNMKGNISSLHSYHRKRVKEEDKAIFGKKVGIGTIVCGSGIFANAVFATDKAYYLEGDAENSLYIYIPEEKKSDAARISPVPAAALPKFYWRSASLWG